MLSKVSRFFSGQKMKPRPTSRDFLVINRYWQTRELTQAWPHAGANGGNDAENGVGEFRFENISGNKGGKE